MPDRLNKIPFVNLGAQWQEDRLELMTIIEKVLSSGQYIGGDEVDIFEKSVAGLCQVKYAIALNSGTDALTLALHLLGVGRDDEVITPPNSFIASTAVIAHVGARPDKIEAAITDKTKAIMPVHLTGRICDMDPILDIAEKHGLSIIEDAAQAIGSNYKNKPSGSFGNVGCFSTHPLKNLNACGDGGFITTDDEKIYSGARALRNHGISDRNNINHFGYVSRMDNLQAAILNYRLHKKDMIIEARRRNAQSYFDGLNTVEVLLPEEKKHEFNTYHTFVIQVEKRNELKDYLSRQGIETAIHYPTPIHLQPAAHELKYKLGDFPVTEKQAEMILTLPINQSLNRGEIIRIISAVNKFYR